MRFILKYNIISGNKPSSEMLTSEKDWNEQKQPLPKSQKKMFKRNKVYFEFLNLFN